jgi:hypothetical protein
MFLLTIQAISQEEFLFSLKLIEIKFTTDLNLAHHALKSPCEWEITYNCPKVSAFVLCIEITMSICT